MNIVWKYKTEVSNTNVFTEIEKERDVKIPDELKDFIKETNAATPSKYNFMLGNVEKIFGGVLSFNRNEPDTDSVFIALMAVEDKKLMPFGIDPFGNYICYHLDSKAIIFWDHETDYTDVICNSLVEFLNFLY